VSREGKFDAELKERLINSAIRAARLAGRVLTRFFWGFQPNSHRLKGVNDLVTTADLESCRVIKKALQRDFPTHSFLFEEPEFSEDKGSEFLWIVDPLDGTTFHHRGLPFYSTILSLRVGRQLEMGVAYTPITGDLFTVWRGDGCHQRNSRFRISRRLQVSRTASLDEAIIGYSYGKSEDYLNDMSSRLVHLLPHCRAMTRVGGADIGYVAAGSCDAFIDNSSTPWDFAAMTLMVEEAGGLVTDFAGQKWTTESKNIVFSNPLLHSQILDLLNRTSIE
jgi:myo-inositol-1(or 4)-monophosphatase